MGALACDRNLMVLQTGEGSNHDKGLIMEEIKDTIKVYKGGRVERTSVPSMPPVLPPKLGVTARDVYIDMSTNVWARIYVPRCEVGSKLPLLVYFHGGGFCVGSTAWKCYHGFLGELSSNAQCLIVSVNYRLAPENPLPGAYEDGIKALMWVEQQANGQSSEYWTRYCNFSNIFLGGDDAGANIAYNVALKLTHQSRPLIIKGIIMVQPFLGGEERTNSEKSSVQSHQSTFSLATTDTYWRLALPKEANRDHPWCNTITKDVKILENTRVVVCIAENDILRDRNLEFCTFLANAGSKVEHTISTGVGHAFHALDNSNLSKYQRKEMISDIMAFISS